MSLRKIACYYYRTQSDGLPVKEFIDSLDFKTQRKFFSAETLLEVFGHLLPEPDAKYIGEDIFELRFGGQGDFYEWVY